ncbi:MAG: type II toxin-antitoxin system HicB family antitoxin [Holosporaceae bacterium]|nr:type II toxin-antitoxin system HicB family antitoxin [Holosporaceae bacterium]
MYASAPGNIVEMRQKSVKVQLTLPEEVLKKIDENVENSFSTRSGWFLEAALEALKRKECNVKKIIELDI